MRALLERRRKDNEGGFTLIELLLVIIILGILAAVVVFSVRGVSDRGKASACKASKAALGTAAEAYYAKLGGYPADLLLLQTEGYVSNFGGTLSPDKMSVSGGDTENNAANSWTITFALPNGPTKQYTLTSTLADC